MKTITELTNPTPHLTKYFLILVSDKHSIASLIDKGEYLYLGKFKTKQLAEERCYENFESIEGGFFVRLFDDDDILGLCKLYSEVDLVGILNLEDIA